MVKTKKTKTKSKPKANMAMLRKVEVKRLDYDINQSGNVLNTFLLNGCQNGVLNYQRVGDMINLKSLILKGSVTFPDTTNNCRMMVVLDTQPNGVAPTASDLFTFPLVPIYSFILPAARRRFKILYDKQYAGGSQGPAARPIKLFKKLNINTYYKGVDNGIGDIQTNALWLISMNDSVALPHPTIHVAGRVTFTDE